jgi:phytoene desaturase
MSRKVAVIGSGIAGLASAIRLAMAGFHVEIFERNSFFGGKIGEYRNNGYRFDIGASLLTLPELVNELFVLAGENPEDFITFEKLDLSCRYFFNDKSFINEYANRKKFCDEVHQKTSTEAVQLQTYLSAAEELFDLTKNVFIFNSFKRLATLRMPEAKRLARKFFKLDAFTSLHHRNQKSLHDPRLVQIFDRYATYNGSDPYRAPATLKIISHLEHNLGVFQPKGGIFELVKSLVKLTEKLDIKIHFNLPVDEIIIKNNSVEGIKCNDKIFDFDIVISDVDIYTIYKKLIKNAKIPWSLKIQELSSSAIIFYWGVRNTYSELDVHNILFSGNYQEEFEAIFKSKISYNDPTIYIYVSSKLNPADAPENCENWFVMINTANNTGQDWKEFRELSRKFIIQKINRILSTQIENYIEMEEYLDPVRIEKYTESYNGSLYGPSSNSKFSAFYRHNNSSRKIRGLYFVGGSVHPGGGIPLCLASAKIVSTLVKESFNPCIE